MATNSIMTETECPVCETPTSNSVYEDGLCECCYVNRYTNLDLGQPTRLRCGVCRDAVIVDDCFKCGKADCRNKYYNWCDDADIICSLCAEPENRCMGRLGEECGEICCSQSADFCADCLMDEIGMN